MTMRGLDRHSTGNWGEGSVPPDSFKASELGNQDSGTYIDLSVPGDPIWAVTIDKVEAWPGGYWLLTTKELAFPVLVKSDDTPIDYIDNPDEEY